MDDEVSANGGSGSVGQKPGRAGPAPAKLPIDPNLYGKLLKDETEGLIRQRIAADDEIRAAAQSRHSIVIVDDHVDVRELLTLRLAMVPSLALVGQASNVRDAIDVTRQLLPDLMILDLKMPGMSGAQGIPLLRAIAPKMRIVLYTADAEGADLSGGSRPDAVVLKGANLSVLVEVVLGTLAEGPLDVIEIDLGRMPVAVAVAAFDSWVGLNARVRHALDTKGDESTELLGDVLPLDSSELLCLMGVFMQFGMPLMMASAAGETEVDLQFTVHRGAGAAARRALLALGGNGTLRAFNRAWSHKPTKKDEQALDLVDKRLVEQLPVS
jgi:CheY-like chemotaxis protein